MKTPISQSTSKTNAKKYNDYFAANEQTYKTMKKSKRIELTENTIKFLAKKAIDEGTSFKPYVEQILESLANTQVGRKKEK
jgi:geranylgeranyl pyrophosphate synthase